METEFFLLKLDDIKELVETAYKITEDNTTRHYIKLALREIDVTKKALRGE